MNSDGWSILGKIVGIQALATAVFTGTARFYWQSLPENIRSQLEGCITEIDSIRRSIDQLTHYQRQCLQAAAQQGKCSSLAQLEHELKRLAVDCLDLKARVDQAQWLERILPPRFSKLWKDIDELKKAIKVLRYDAWKSTSGKPSRASEG